MSKTKPDILKNMIKFRHLWGRYDNNIDERRIERYLSCMLLNLGIPAKNMGFFFIKESVKIAFEEPATRFSMKESIFDTLANKYETTVANIERSIRHALRIAERENTINCLSELLHTNESYEISHPSVCEFISLLAETVSFANC